MTTRRYYRSRSDRRIAGVAAGLAAYFDLDPTLVRVAWAVFALTTGFGLILYIALALVAPLEPYPNGNPGAGMARA